MRHSAATSAPTRFAMRRRTSTTRSKPATRSRTSSPILTACAGFARSPLTLTWPARQAVAPAERVFVSRTAQIHASTRTLDGLSILRW